MGQAQLKGEALDASSLDLVDVSDEALLRAAACVLRARPSLKQALLGKLAAPIDYEELKAADPEALAKAGGITMLYQTPWPAPRIHCRAGSDQPWTDPPGVPLVLSRVPGFTAGWFGLRFPSARCLEFLMNDGVPKQWDKLPSGANYQVFREGLWLLQGGRLEEYGGVKLAEVAVPEVPSAPIEGLPVQWAKEQGGVLLLYRTPWPRPYLHFRPNELAPWTAIPGKAMIRSGFSGFSPSEGWWSAHVPGTAQLEFLTNDGGASWDKAPNDANYRLASAGAWRLLDGRLERLDVAAAVPPAVQAWMPQKVAAPLAPVEVKLKVGLTSADALPVPGTLAEQLGSEGLTLLYRSAWPAPHLHCREAEDAAWTAMPGLLFPRAGEAICKDLEASPEGGHGTLFGLHFPKASALEFVINDGGPHFRWDKASSGANFRIALAGVWSLSGGRLEKVLPPPPAPGQPTVHSVARTSVTISWPSVASGLRGYKIFRDGLLAATISGGATRYTSTGLTASKQYAFTVAAVSTQGVQGPVSGVVQATTEAAGRPGAPEGLRVARACGKGITLEWSCPEDNGGAPITAYSVERDGKFAATVRATDPSPTALFTWTDANVEQGVSYSYAVTACHLPTVETQRKAVLEKRQEKLAPEEHDILLAIPEELNVGPAAGPVEAEAVDELEAGECHKDLRQQLKSRGITIYYKTTWDMAFAHCCTKPELGWTKPPGLTLEPSPTTAFPCGEGWHVLYLPYARHLEMVMNNGAQQWDKAPGGSNYKVDVPGVLRLANGHLDRVAAPPQSPSGLAAEALDGSRTSLTWKAALVANGEAPIRGYKVYRNGRLVTMTEGVTCKFVDKNLFAFTDYEYSVAAVNSQEVVGPLCPSTQVKTAMPGPPSVPRNLRASASKDGGKLCVTLEWEPPEDCAGAPVSSYEIFRNGTIISVYDVPSTRLRSEAEACQPVDPDAGAERRWVRSTCSYSRLAWFKDALEWTDTTVEMGENYSYQVRAVQLGPDRADELKKDGLVQRCGSRFLDCIEPDVVGAACEPVEVRAVPFLDPPRLGEQKCMIMFQAFDWGSCKANSWYTILLGLLPELRTAGINMMWLPPPSDSVDEHGYLPRKWHVLDNHYGSAAALQRLVSAMHEQEIYPILDVVVNHRCASLQDSAGRWLKFEEPDWEGWAICCDSPAVPGGSGARCTGEPAQYAPSVDHSNPKIREDVNAYIRHMMEDMGFRALRFDFVKGYSPHFQRDYVRAAGSPFAVAENWNGDANSLHGYVRECQGCMAVYDFPLYYILKRTIHANNFAELNEDGRLCGILGRDPARAVTFIDNHDTYQLAIVGGAFGNNEQVLRAYAFILTHPGVPCVFHYDYVRGPQVREKILQLCSIRRNAGLHSTSQVQICSSGQGLYAAIVGNRVAFKMGTNDWSPGGGWNFACSGCEWAVWTRG